MDAVQDARAYALSEISKYGLPNALHFEISEKKALELAEKLKADTTIVHIGVCFMDLKLGQAFAEKKVDKHIEMGVTAAKEFLKKYKLDKVAQEKIINCIEAHHGTIPFTCKEAEICANADCYRILTPRGFFIYLSILMKRGLDIDECLLQAEEKIEEKRGVLSMDECKRELIRHYEEWKRFIQEAKKN